MPPPVWEMNAPPRSSKELPYIGIGLEETPSAEEPEEPTVSHTVARHRPRLAVSKQQPTKTIIQIRHRIFAMNAESKFLLLKVKENATTVHYPLALVVV